MFTCILTLEVYKNHEKKRWMTIPISSSIPGLHIMKSKSKAAGRWRWGRCHWWSLCRGWPCNLWWPPAAARPATTVLSSVSPRTGTGPRMRHVSRVTELWPGTCHGAVTSAGSAAASRRSARGRGCDVRSAAAVSRCHPSLPPRPASHLATSSSINKSGQSKLGDQFTSCISPDCCRAFPACPVSGAWVRESGCRGRAGSEAVPWERSKEYFRPRRGRRAEQPPRWTRRTCWSPCTRASACALPSPRSLRTPRPRPAPQSRRSCRSPRTRSSPGTRVSRAAGRGWWWARPPSLSTTSTSAAANPLTTITTTSRRSPCPQPREVKPAAGG